MQFCIDVKWKKQRKSSTDGVKYIWNVEYFLRCGMALSENGLHPRRKSYEMIFFEGITIDTSKWVARISKYSIYLHNKHETYAWNMKGPHCRFVRLSTGRVCSVINAIKVFLSYLFPNKNPVSLCLCVWIVIVKIFGFWRTFEIIKTV